MARVTVVTPGSVPRLPKPAQLESASVKLTPIPTIPRRRRVVVVMTGLLSVVRITWGDWPNVCAKRIRFVADATLDRSTGTRSSLS